MITALLILLLAGLLVYAIAFKKYPPALYVLAYQKIGVAPKNSRFKNTWTTPARLEKDFQFLRRYGFHTLHPKELGKPATKPVLLAFIGGYQPFFTEVFPLLKKYNLKACVFLTPDTIGTYNRWQNPHTEPWQNILTAQQLEILARSPLVSFGTLGLTENGAPLFEITLTQNTLEESIARFERLYKISVTAACVTSKNTTLPNTTLPVLLPQTGKNALTETQYLRIIFPTFCGRFRLWQHR